MKRLIIAASVAALTISSVGAAIAAPPMSGNHSSNYSDRGTFERHGNYADWNGHRGYKNKRPGYQYYNGYWFPVAAFAFFSILGGIFSQMHNN